MARELIIPVRRIGRGTGYVYRPVGVRAGLLQIVSGLASPEIRDDALGQASRLLLPAIGDHLPDRYWRALS
jgi:hypothetical protein